MRRRSLPLPDAFTLLTPEDWTREYWETLKRDVFGPVDGRRRTFRRRRLSRQERAQLLWQVRFALAMSAIDFRGHGRSTAGTDSHALFEDVLAAARYLHSHGVTRIAVLGASMGGSAVAEAAVRAAHGEIERVILLSPVPIPDPEHLQGPVLFIASRDEPTVAQITEQFRRAPEPKRLVLLPGAAYAPHICAAEQPEPLRTTVSEFLGAREGTPRKMVPTSGRTG